MFTERMIERIAIPEAAKPPANYAANTYTSGGITMKNFRRLMAHINVGVIASGNVQCYLQASAESSANFTNISGGDTITLTASNTQGVLEISSDQIGSSNQYVRLVVVNGGAAFMSWALFGSDSAHKPASQYDVNSGLTKSAHTVS